MHSVDGPGLEPKANDLHARQDGVIAIDTRTSKSHRPEVSLSLFRLSCSHIARSLRFYLLIGVENWSHRKTQSINAHLCWHGRGEEVEF